MGQNRGCACIKKSAVLVRLARPGRILSRHARCQCHTHYSSLPVVLSPTVNTHTYTFIISISHR